MAEEPLHQILDEMRSRIQAELDGQVQTLRAREAEAVARARQQAEAEADKRWASKVEAVKSEWTARLQSEVSAAQAEAEKRLVAETMRIRSEAEQAAAAERERTVAELDAERLRTAAELEAERQRAAAQLDAERRQIEQQLEDARAAFEAERDRLEREVRSRQPSGVEAESVLRALRTMDAARSLSDALTSLVRGAAQHAPRVALFIVNGTRFDEWSASDVEQMSREPVDLEHSGLLGLAVTRGSRVSAPGDAASAPSFAILAGGRAATAVPLMVDGQAVAVLYADEGTSTSDPEPHGWADAVELLARHGAACLAHLTAVRSLQVLQGGNGKRRASAAPPDQEQSARRYARLLVSEIKLYNEGAVRVGRERRDLLQRLKAEIDRARRLYEERVSPTVSARGAYFQQELIQTLAGGDPALLGS